MSDPGHDRADLDDDTTVTREQWKWSILAGMASFLDAGSIVALGATLAIWQGYLDLSADFVGVITALGPNAIGCGLGAFLGGRLGDMLGRKRIYQYDLIVYALAALTIALSVNSVMLLVGTFVLGLAVGADVPTSLALVGEFAPTKSRGKLLGFSQVAWYTGPVVVLFLALAVSDLEVLGARILFLTLVVVAVVTYVLRRGLTESARWVAASQETSDDPDAASGTTSEESARGAVPTTRQSLRQLMSGPHLRALLWTATIYITWNTAAGTGGIFTPYIIRTLGAGSQAASVGLSAIGFVVSLVATVFIFMRLVDRGHAARKWMWGIGGLMQVISYGLYLVFPFTVTVIVANILLFGIGAALAGEGTYKTASQELFPTMVRGTAQGITFGFARLVLGVWSFYVPILAATGIRPVAGILTALLAVSAVVGFFGMPNTAGKTLEQIEEERGTKVRTTTSVNGPKKRTGHSSEGPTGGMETS